MDGLHAQAAAGRFEQAGEQGAGLGARLGPRILAERGQLGAEVRILEPNPVREPGVDPPRHLGRARLGEGQAQDRGGIDARQQQPEHAGGQDMGLAGPRRGRERRMAARLRGAMLRAFEAVERLEAMGHIALSLMAGSDASGAAAASATAMLRYSRRGGDPSKRTC